MGKLFDFNGDGNVDALEMLIATAGDPNNPFHSILDDSDKLTDEDFNDDK